MSEEPTELTLMLHKACRGDEDARSDLYREVEQKLHAMAKQRLRQENAGVTLQATALVHDAFIQLIGREEAIDWSNRKHFYVMAAKAMRHILVDHARSRRALKRGGDRQRTADDVGQIADRNAAIQQDVLALHDALKRLAEIDSRQAQIVELRHFGGYTVEETADLLDVSPRTVKADFAAAKAWLFRELSPS
ncbi:ECF-type sigma factor [Aeoliella sp.]|uniref:ECF-type sigma factor n=1 Tax=Aeoliella sp. TaxID=2795800 RepID=UPI003CCB7913